MEGSLIRILFFLLPTLASADPANNEWNSTTRSLSMGNLGIASAEDSTTAMFYNPAALARTKKFTAEFMNPQFDIGSGLFTLGRGITDAPKHTSLGTVRPLVEARSTKASYLGFSLYPNLSAQNFNFGILAKGEGLSYHDGTKLNYRSKYLLIPTLGISMGALSGRFRIGAAARAIQITENDRSLMGTIASNGSSGASPSYTGDAQEGFGIGLDAGTLITLPWTALPTLGFVARNIGDTSFSGSAPFGVGTGTVKAKEKIKMTYDAGFTLSPKMGKRSVLVFGADYRDVLDQNGINLVRRINLGLELSFSRFFYLRTGVSRGYFTAGVGFASKYGSLDLGTYAEELDARKLRVREDRRYSLRFGRKF